MERLPTDLVQCILRKLAMQDPLSLLQASSVYTSLHQAVEKDTALWKEAFLASAGSFEQSFNVLLSDPASAALDTEVASLGGYKRLALVKVRHMQNTQLEMSSSPGVEQTPSANHKAGESVSENVRYVARYLHLCRLRGRLIGWRTNRPKPTSYLAHPEEILSSGEPGECFSVSIQKVSESTTDPSPPSATINGLGLSYKDTIKAWLKIAGSTTLRSGRRVIKERLTVETYAFMDDVID